MPRIVRNKSYIILMLVLALTLAVLVGCGDDGATVSSTDAEQTVLPTFTPFPTATPTAAATATPVPTDTPEPTPTPNPNVNPLTGLVVDNPELLNLRPIAFRVGNDPIARPQDGLSSAAVVWEEVMEGYSITRFTAIVYGEEVEMVRPIRSARLSSIQIAPMYDAALAHSGASDTIRWLISQASFVNLDEYYTRTGYHYLGADWRTRLYADPAELHEYLADNDLERSEPIEGYTFDETVPLGSTAESIHIPYPSTCFVDWKYDAETDTYLRWVTNVIHADGLTGEQLAADNVVILYAVHGTTNIVEDTNGATAIDIQLTGTGDAVLIRNGVAVECQWIRPDDGGLLQFYDEDGELVPLKPGKTWIEMVPPDYDVTIE